MAINITLGQYVPGASAVHRLDPRTKILLMIAYIVLIFLVRSLAVFLVPLAFLVLTVLLSRVPVSYLWTAVKPMRLLIVFMFIINLFFTPGGTPLFSFWRITIFREGLMQGLFITARLLLLVAGTSILTLTTSPIALTDGLEKLLMPLSKLRFPAHELAMMMTIALRFIPTLMEETDRIRKAQMARGADFESGNLVKRAKAMVPVLVPLFVSAFRRADELAMAMESRCYHGGEGRTRMRILKLQWADGLAGLALALMSAAIIIGQRLLF